MRLKNRQADRHHRETRRQAGRQTYRQTNREIKRQIGQNKGGKLHSYGTLCSRHKNKTIVKKSLFMSSCFDALTCVTSWIHGYVMTAGLYSKQLRCQIQMKFFYKKMLIFILYCEVYVMRIYQKKFEYKILIFVEITADFRFDIRYEKK